MRTAAQDLAALNQYATSNVATADMTPAQRTEERQALNQPSRQYFKQVQATINDITRPPAFQPRNQITQEMIAAGAAEGLDYSKARMDWVLSTNKDGKQQWAVAPVGVLRMKPNTPIDSVETAKQYWMSDAAPLGEISRQIGDSPTRNVWSSSVSGVNLSELSQAIPEIQFSEFQEIIYQLTLERDTDITIEDILDKYDEMYGEGK
jgi:hypothetical protein